MDYIQIIMDNSWNIRYSYIQMIIHNSWKSGVVFIVLNYKNNKMTLTF